MDRDSFIIQVYCLVVETYKIIRQQHKLRRGGFLPALTDEEVITMEICGEYFKLHPDKDLFEYFQSHYLDFFPNLACRAAFVRACGKAVARNTGNLAALGRAERARQGFNSSH